MLKNVPISKTMTIKEKETKINKLMREIIANRNKELFFKNIQFFNEPEIKFLKDKLKIKTKL